MTNRQRERMKVTFAKGALLLAAVLMIVSSVSSVRAADVRKTGRSERSRGTTNAWRQPTTIGKAQNQRPPAERARPPQPTDAASTASEAAPATPELSPGPAAAAVNGSEPEFVAYGFGAAATGGRDHPVVTVTTLRDAGARGAPIPGSLRAALSGGNRIVRFRVSGNIELVDQLKILHPNITIDGSDAPNGGIAIWGSPVLVEADNVVIRHLRFRGSHPTEAVDGLSIGGGSDILIDHISCSWATDECLSMYGYSYSGTGRVRRVTVQNSLFAEMAQGHNMATLVNGDVSDVTWFRNVFAKSDNRNPQISTGQRRGPHQSPGERLSGIAEYELIQNVVYDAAYGTRIWNQSPDWTIHVDAIGNLWKPGPRWPDPKVPIMISARPASVGPIRVFLDRNSGPRRGTANARDCDFFSLESANAPCAGYDPRHRADQRLIQSHSFPAATAAGDLPNILANVGATLPCRDSVDRRIIEEVRTGTGHPMQRPGPLPNLDDPCE